MPAAPEKPLIEKNSGRPVVCYITERKALGSTDSAAALELKIRVALAAGVDWVQIREKDLPGRDLLALARAAVTMAADAVETEKPRVFVNDRLDVALAAGAAGVHLGGESLPAREVVGWRRAGNAPAEFLIGSSCHSLEQATEAERAGVDYVFFGPVFDTPSKREFGPPQGIARLSEVCRALRIPVIAIGGVNEENAAECVRAGAAGIAAIRLFQEERDQASLREAINRLHARES